MDKNKSIDGLSSRRSQKATTSSKTTTKAKTTQKTATKKTTAKKAAPKKTTTKTTSKKTVKKTTAPKTVKKSPKAPAVAPITDNITPKNATTKDTPAKDQSKSDLKPQTTDPTADFLKPVQAFDFDEQSGQLVAAKEDPTQKGKKMKKIKKPISKKRKIIRGVIIGILSLLLIAGIIFIIWGNDIIAKITGGQGNVFDLIFQDETYEPLKTDENGRTNILAIGTSGYNMEGDEGDGTHDGAQLTDSIMVISLNQETGDVAMLSLPRDLKVSYTCTATGKINEVYWCNNMDGEDEQAGAQAIMDVVGEVLDIDFQYYAHLNWGSLISIVDAINGITVTTDETIEYDYIGYNGENVVDTIQENTPTELSGRASLGLARARHQTLHGDFSRGASQQKILIGIKDKIFEKDLSVTDLLGLANTLGENLRTNFSIDEMKTLAHLFSEFDFDSMRQVSLIEPEMYVTTGTINGISYVLPVGGAGYYTAIQNYVAKMFSNYPQVYEDYTILVLNGTDTPGLATTEQANLEKDNYQHISTDNAPEGEYTEEYTLYALTDAAPGTKKALEEKYHTTAKSADELPASIDPTSYDFILIIGKAD